MSKFTASKDNLCNRRVRERERKGRERDVDRRSARE